MISTIQYISFKNVHCIVAMYQLTTIIYVLLMLVLWLSWSDGV